MTNGPKNKKITARSLEVRKSPDIGQHTSMWARIIYNIRLNSPLIVVSAFTQIFAGAFLIVCALIGSFKPLWAASIATIAGSICTLVGFFLFYEVLHRKDVRHDLFRESIRRVIDNQN